MDRTVGYLNAHLLLGSSQSVLENLQLAEYDKDIIKCYKNMLSGESYKVVLENISRLNIDSNGIKDERSLLDVLQISVKKFVQKNVNSSLLFGIALVQTFVQINFSGPGVELEPIKQIFHVEDKDRRLHKLMVSLLSIRDQSAYELCADPIYLVLGLLVFEQITEQPTLFLADSEEPVFPNVSAVDTPSILACAHWWRSRALQIQVSLVHEADEPQSRVACRIMSCVELVGAIVNGIPNNVSGDFKKRIYIIFYLENAKCSLLVNSEQFCLTSLLEAKKLSGFRLILTGARAKRTKHQKTAHSGLVILAKSSLLNNSEGLSDIEEAPAKLLLDSDFLLEKPYFESIGNEQLDENLFKNKDINEDECFLENGLLPYALRQEFIPAELKNLDPNNQPVLANYDNIQLLLRFYIIKKTTPANNPMIEEELNAILSRILYQEGEKNWCIYSRALWERSILESTRTKTIERAILQMQSLVDELGLVGNKNVEDVSLSSPYYRLKYIYQLPFLPRWVLDATLAEKFMSIGVMSSAVDIYERLDMACEAALCYATFGNETKAERILLDRIEKKPNDARAYSILGDIRQDPTLWEKSWEIGKYVNAKNSLGRYYYSPPKESNLECNYDLALKHLKDSLTKSPLNFEIWYFYGCIGLKSKQFKLAAEAFSRCVSLDEINALAWSNLSAAYIELGKPKEAHSCLKRAISSDAQTNEKIWENYMLVSLKLNEWDDVLAACKHLVSIKSKKVGEGSIDIPVVEKLADLLVSGEFPVDDSKELTYFQKMCMEFICETLPKIITTSVRCWKIVSRVELWRNRPNASLECQEKAFRAITHNPSLEFNEDIWNNSVDACEDLVLAYRSLSQMQGKDAEPVCKDWRYKAKSATKSLMSKGRSSWEDTEGWEKLINLRNNL